MFWNKHGENIKPDYVQLEYIPPLAHKPWL